MSDQNSNPEINRFLENKELEFVQHEYIDQTGTVRGKLAPIASINKVGTLVNLVLCTRSDEEIVMTPFADLEDGFSKLPMAPDLSTAFVMPWRPNTVAVINDLLDKDGKPCLFCPRQILSRASARLAVHGLKSKVGVEYEFQIFKQDEEAVREGRIKDLVEVGQNRNAFSLIRTKDVLSLAEELFRRMDASGAPLEVLHPEYSRGMYELTLAPLDAMQAADGLARAKLYTKEMLRENGLTTTPMTALHLFPNCSQPGIHNNVSLWQDGKNVFWDPDCCSLTQLGRHFCAGLLATMQDFHLIFRPWVNSYRRFNPDEFSPVHAAWGEDNHLVSLRMVHGHEPEKQTRFEHRVAGSDTCPHLVLAAILEGGLYGIENELELVPETKFTDLENAPLLSNTLPDAIEKFKSSEVGNSIFGSDFVQHFCQIREEEWADYAGWCEEHNIDVDHNGPNVTTWEYQRYFDWLQ